MTKRKGISNKIRFEVFKRDSFTCQYCGCKAPDVILNVDHINPVKNGGDNNIMNLITSCFDCNSGKKARLISDDTILKKQQRQIEELNQRREQLEMLMKWRDGLQELTNLQTAKIVEYIENYISGLRINDNFKKTIHSWVKKYNADLIFESVDESATRYLILNNGKPTRESAELYLNKIKGILFFKSLPTLEQKKNWIKSIAAKKFNSKGWQFENLISRYILALQNYGWSDYEIMDDLQCEVIKLLNDASYESQFNRQLEKWIDSIKKWD